MMRDKKGFVVTGAVVGALAILVVILIVILGGIPWILNRFAGAIIIGVGLALLVLGAVKQLYDNKAFVVITSLVLIGGVMFTFVPKLAAFGAISPAGIYDFSVDKYYLDDEDVEVQVKQVTTQNDLISTCVILIDGQSKVSFDETSPGILKTYNLGKLNKGVYTARLQCMSGHRDYQAVPTSYFDTIEEFENPQVPGHIPTYGKFAAEQDFEVINYMDEPPQESWWDKVVNWFKAKFSFSGWGV